MSGESVEAHLARQDERWKFVQEEMQEAKLSRKAQYDQMESMRLTVQALSTKVASVETSLAKANPTIEEFITIKHKVTGAGAAGKYIWAAVAATLTFIAASRENIKAIAAWFLQ